MFFSFVAIEMNRIEKKLCKVNKMKLFLEHGGIEKRQFGIKTEK